LGSEDLKKWGGTATLLILFFFCASAASALEESSVRVSVQKTEVRVGESFTVLVLVEPNEPITGLEVSLSFNPDVLSLTDVRYQELLGTGSFYVPPKIDEENGHVLIAGTTLNGATISSSGTFARLAFRGKKAGYSELKIKNASMVRIENSSGGTTIAYLSCALENSGVNVLAQESPAGGNLRSSAPTGNEVLVPLAGGILLLLALLIILITVRRSAKYQDETYFW